MNHEQMLEYNAANNPLSIEILKGVDPANEFKYKNSKGQIFHNTYADVMFHLINHGTYHRGQINSSLRSAGIEPVVIEFIYLRR